MRFVLNVLMIMINISFIHCHSLPGSDPPVAGSLSGQSGNTTKTGTIASDLLVECSGIDRSMIRDDLLWAINDSGDGPYLYAMGIDGRDRGRIKIAGAVNRDWEDLATFKWQDRSMILVADVGDNREHHGHYRLYIVEEPRLSGQTFDPSATANVVWTLSFSYPDRSHDAEAVSIDPTNGQILVLTKRDTPPLLFSLPLKPAQSDKPLVARRIAAIDRIPPPNADDLLYPYGRFRSQPTAMDLSTDGLKMVVLTYKYAYLFSQTAGDTWQTLSDTPPVVVPLPLPQHTHNFVQREAACFSRAADRLVITSEGLHAAIYRCDIVNR